jgi:hypothetical protein
MDHSLSVNTTERFSGRSYMLCPLGELLGMPLPIYRQVKRNIPGIAPVHDRPARKLAWGERYVSMLPTLLDSEHATHYCFPSRGASLLQQ